MAAERGPAVAGLHAAVQINAVLDEIIGEVDFLVGGKIQHQEKRGVGIRERDVLAVAGHVVRGRVEQEGVGVDPGRRYQVFELRQRRRLRRIGRRERWQEISLEMRRRDRGLAAIAVRRAGRRPRKAQPRER